MMRVGRAVIVEGRYDQIKLASLVDGIILPVSGFRIFKDRAMMALIRKLAGERGIIVLTDSDTAGFKIRNHIASAVPPEQVLHAYIPDIPGKERRKSAPGKEGKLGVEGVPAECIIEALRRAGALTECAEVCSLTKADLYERGLSGGRDSALRRKLLMKRLELPEHLSANGLISVLPAVLGCEDRAAALESLDKLLPLIEEDVMQWR